MVSVGLSHTYTFCWVCHGRKARAQSIPGPFFSTAFAGSNLERFGNISLCNREQACLPRAMK